LQKNLRDVLERKVDQHVKISFSLIPTGNYRFSLR